MEIQRDANANLHYDKKGFNLNPTNTLRTKNKEVKTFNWSKDNHWENKAPAYLLSLNKQFGIKTGR